MSTLDERPVRVVLFADLAGFTALTEAHGDRDAADVAARFTAIAQEALRGGAKLVKSFGDGILVVADDPGSGLDTALALVDAVHAEVDFPQARAGIHIGPLVEREGDVFGATVNVAARVTGRALPGQLVCTDAFALALDEDLRGSLRLLGSERLRHVAEPVDLHEVRRAAAAAIDPVCKMRIDPDRAAMRVEVGGREWLLCSLGCAQILLERPELYIDTAP